MLGVLALASISCTKENEIEIPNGGKFYTVQVNMAGEIDVDYEPLTKASLPTGLYGISVESTPDVELAEGETATWTPYAYYYNASFSSLEITLKEGFKYRFKALILVDGQNKLESPVGKNALPFALVDASNSLQALSVSSSFRLDTNTSLQFRSQTTLKDTKTYDRPNLDAYYCEGITFTPSVANTSVSLEMKRVSFGAKFVVEGNLATSGTLNIGITGAPAQSLVLSSTATDNVISDIFLFNKYWEAFKNDSYSEVVPVTLSWTKADGTKQEIGTYQITYQRNTTTVVTVKLHKDTFENSVGLVIKDTEAGTMAAPGTHDVTIN